MELNEKLAKLQEFEDRIKDLINELSLENLSNTPDFILASHLRCYFEILSQTIMERSNWYGNVDEIGYDEVNN